MKKSKKIAGDSPTTLLYVLPHKLNQAYKMCLDEMQRFFYAVSTVEDLKKDKMKSVEMYEHVYRAINLQTGPVVLLVADTWTYEGQQAKQSGLISAFDCAGLLNYFNKKSPPKNKVRVYLFSNYPPASADIFSEGWARPICNLDPCYPGEIKRVLYGR